EIDRAQKIIRTHNGRTDHYDILVLATGSAAFVPTMEGTERHGVFVYRTIEDLHHIETYSKKASRGAVMGGGLLGLEAAKALVDLGLETHVVEFAPRLMPRQVDDAGADVLKMKLQQFGLHVHTGKNTQAIEGNGKLEGLVFSDGSRLAVDMLVISAGIRPRDELARACGLRVAARGGIVVDDYMRTDDASIFAIGECVSHNNMVYGLVAPGYEMAEVVVRQLNSDVSRSFRGFDMSTKLKLIGVDVASFGDPFAETPGSVPIAFKDTRKGVYKRINVSEDGKYLVGGILVGDASAYNMLHQMVVNRMPLPENPEALIGIGAGAHEQEGGGVGDLPDTAQICSCENVTKADIVGQVTQHGATKIEDIKKATRACTGCGGCTPLVNDLLKQTLESLGHTIGKSLCEHFDYSRQELYVIVRVTGARTFDDLLDSHVKGDSCEIYKPAVASILASAWNEPVPELATIQDTNDRYLANIQRGGTYSVVPRIPGGEITPAKLMAIGRIAKQ